MAVFNFDKILANNKCVFDNILRKVQMLIVNLTLSTFLNNFLAIE
jgi:hypothetical protein